MKARSLRDEHADQTRAVVLASARKLFASQGYHATSIDQLAAAARVTKGAVYHHFDDKTRVLASVYEQIAAELEAELRAHMARTPDPVAKVARAIEALLAAADVADVRVILFREGPAVLAGECRAIDERHFLGLIREVFDELEAEGRLAAVDTALLSRLLLSVFVEASQILGNARNVKQTRAALATTLTRLLDGVIVER
jgi:AcrR family transcriptional regulator